MTRLAGLLTVVCGLALAACGGKDKAGEEIVTAGDLGSTPDGCVPYCGEWGEAQCGDDGCGGSCGGCEPGAVCGEADYDDIGICFDEVEQCPGICGDAECGFVWTGLWEPEMCECGTCPAGTECVGEYDEEGGYCSESCEGDDCPENECWASQGQEGGLGSPCKSDEDCIFDLCRDPAYDGAKICTCPCGGDCPHDFLCLQTYARIGGPDYEFACFPPCEPDCSGKECGEDGCGSACGTCVEGISCQDGECLHPWWTDATTGLSWQNPPAEGKQDWEPAKWYCEGLELGGYTDWHLPTISELRSLIRGCPGTVTGGDCGVTDSCYALSCFDEEACYSCPYDVGPADGCYWPDEMQGPCTFYWSSLEAELYFAWYVSFSSGRVGNGTYYDGYVRCVR